MIINGFGGDKPSNPGENLGWVAISSITATNVVPSSAAGNYPLVPETATPFKFDFRPYKAMKIQLSNFSIAGTCTNATASTSKYMIIGVWLCQRQSYSGRTALWEREYVAKAANAALSSCQYQEYCYIIYPWLNYSYKPYTSNTLVYDFMDVNRNVGLPQTDNTSLVYDFHMGIKKVDSNAMSINNWKISGTWTLMGLPW